MLYKLSIYFRHVRCITYSLTKWNLLSIVSIRYAVPLNKIEFDNKDKKYLVTRQKYGGIGMC